MEEKDVTPDTDVELKLRMYKTDDSDLQKYLCTINPYPEEAVKKVETIINDAVKNSPDKPDASIKLAAEKRDADLKRMMKPKIEKLKGETVLALKKMRANRK